MSPEAHARLVELDAVARACREFYEYATAVLPASPLRLRCQRLAQAKSELVAVLALRLPQPAPPPVDDAPTAVAATDGLRERIERALRRARAGLSTPDPARLWDEFQRIEAVIAAACAQAGRGDDADSRREMARLLPLVERCRDEFVADATAAG